LSILDPCWDRQRLGYNVGVELLDPHVPEPLCVRLRFREDPRKAGQAGKGEQHTPVVLSGGVNDRAERRQFFGGQILCFVDEDRKSDAFFFGRVGELVDEFPEVGVKDAGVCSSTGRSSQVDAEGPGTGSVVGGLKAQSGPEALQKPPAGTRPRKIRKRGVKGFAQQLSQRLVGASLDLRDDPFLLRSLPSEL
jgi:hypothetical protein